MSVRSSQSITVLFTTRRFDTGAATNGDSTPTGTLYVNGTADAASVTVTNVTTGLYKAAVTLPTLSAGDVADLRISATVNSVSDNAVVWRDTKDLALDSSYRPGIDWANVGSPTTTLALTGTTIATTQKVDVETIKTGAVVNGGTVTFPTNATLASTTNVTAGTITTVTTLTNLPAITAGWLTATGIATDAFTAAKFAADCLTAAKIADGAIDTATFAAGTTIPRCTLADTLTTYTNNTAQTGDAYAVVSSGTSGNAALKTLIDAVDDYVDTEVAAIKAKTDNLPASPAASSDCLTAAGVRSAVGLASANLDTQLTAIDDYIDTEVAAIKAKTDNLPAAPASAGDVTGLLTTQLTESYNADGAAPTLAQALFVIMQRLTEFSISGTTITVQKLDGSTSAYTLTLDSADAPTSSTRAT